MRGACAFALAWALVGCGEPPPDPARERAKAGLAALDGWWFESIGQWTEHWWNNANTLTVTVDYTARSGDATWRPLIAQVYDKNQGKQFLNDFYDDEGWWALAWVAAYDLTGEARYLDAAKVIFADVAKSWDGTCGGGVWWDRVHSYKNAITNELFLTLAARLHLRTPGDMGPGSYLDWAQREWAWFQASGVLVAGVVNDGVDLSCAPLAPPQVWTYNQGVILGGLADLARAGDATLLDRAAEIADAARAHLTDGDGILHDKCEPATCNADGAQFKGVFVRNLDYLETRRPTPAWRDLLEKNAAAVWDHDRSGPEGGAVDPNSFGLVWSGPFDTADPVRQTSAVDALVAMLPPAQ